MTAAQNRLSAEERRTQILEAALEVFARQGFSGARTKEIARRARVSETLIFRHFDNKENLYHQALAHLFGHHPLTDDLAPAMAAEDDQEVFFQLARHIMEHSRQDPRIVRLSLYSALEDMGRTHRDSVPMQVLAAYLERRMQAGALADGDPEMIARFFIYGIFMYVSDVQLQFTGPPPMLSDQEAARRLVDIFMKGLLPRD